MKKKNTPNPSCQGPTTLYPVVQSHSATHTALPPPLLPSRELSPSQAGFILLGGFLSLARVRDSFSRLIKSQRTHTPGNNVHQRKGSEPWQKTGRMCEVAIKYQNISAPFLALIPEQIIEQETGMCGRQNSDLLKMSMS